MSKFIEELNFLPTGIDDESLLIVAEGVLSNNPKAYKIKAIDLKNYILPVPPDPGEEG